MQREPPSAGAAAFEDSRQQRERERRQPLVEQSVRSQDVAGQRAAERRARETEPAAIDSMEQSNAEVEAAFEQEGGDTRGDNTCAFRSSSAASTVDVSMAGLEATNGEEDPGYATDCYGADNEAMEE